jgi:hypothetical protein
MKINAKTPLISLFLNLYMYLKFYLIKVISYYMPNEKEILFIKSSDISFKNITCIIKCINYYVNTLLNP